MTNHVPEVLVCVCTVLKQAGAPTSEIGTDSYLGDYLDSLNLVNLAMLLEEKCAVKFKRSDLADTTFWKTPGEIAALVTRVSNRNAK